MKKNYEENAIGLLRTNKALPSDIAKEIEGIFNDSFTVNANDWYLTNIDLCAYYVSEAQRIQY